VVVFRSYTHFNIWKLRETFKYWLHVLLLLIFYFLVHCLFIVLVFRMHVYHVMVVFRMEGNATEFVIDLHDDGFVVVSNR
jgi:hypothetical protein